MKQIRLWLETYMEDYNIKKKFYIFYIACVLLPLFLTDSIVGYLMLHSEQKAQTHEMENMANAIQYRFGNCIDSALELEKSIYTNKYIDEFLEHTYRSPQEYVTEYHQFLKNSLIESCAGMANMKITMFSDNPTIINGGNFKKLDAQVRDMEWYEDLKKDQIEKELVVLYDISKERSGNAKRRIYLIQKLNFFGNQGREKLLRIEIDYGTMIRNMVKMNYDHTAYICQNNRILFSNRGHNSVSKEFETFCEHPQVGYQKEIEVCGQNYTLYVLEKEGAFLKGLMEHFTLILLLLCMNLILPIWFGRIFEQSFTKRITALSDIMSNAKKEHLVEIYGVQGRDEIASLFRDYNRMVRRINDLIEQVYKNRIREQEMMVARKNAELLALHSQINPHFLFNALESIRMHSIIKQEFETAEMVENLALMQRQYVEWGCDNISIQREMEFVEAYLGLQKYRFGDRLSYQISIDPECKNYKIPKLSIVTYVENACIHGIESKTSNGWIFVRVKQEDHTLFMEIEDTGYGMDEEKQQELLNKMQNADIDMLKEKQRVGMINACLRLKIFSDHHVTFDLESEEGVGTMVMIRIPLEYVW